MGSRFGWHSGVANVKGITIGKSTLPELTQTRAINVYTQSSNTSADTRAAYIRHYIKAATSNGGEAVRAFTTLNAAVAGGAHGLHASLSCGTGGSITGLGCAARATLQVPNAALAGTTAAVMAEIYAEGTSSNNTGTMSHFRVSLTGNETGVAALKDVYFMEFDGMSAGSAEYIDTSKTAGTAYGGLKVKIPGVGDRWILLVSA
jgi:hypothetical protein